MYSSQNEPQKNTDQSVAKPATQQKMHFEPVDHLSTNRNKQAAQLQEIADRYTLGQQKPNGQAASSNVSETTDGVVQRAINVHLTHSTASKKKLVANGQVKDFVNGSAAGKNGWLGVESYRARYKIEDDDDLDEDEVGPFLNDFTNPEAGHVLGQQNGGVGTDPENIFAQDGGTNNGKYKAFEGRMRKALNLYAANDPVEFVAYLAGTNITSGKIADAGKGAAMDISSEDDD